MERRPKLHFFRQFKGIDGNAGALAAGFPPPGAALPHHLNNGRSRAKSPATPFPNSESGMKISGVDIRPGNIIEYEGGIWRAVKIQHTQPGKGGAYMQVEMKNLIDGRKNNVRFRSAETVERVRLDTKDFQFLFRDGDMLTFMDKESYEQITLPADLLGDAAAFLQDGMDVVMELYDERPISVQLPDTPSPNPLP